MIYLNIYFAFFSADDNDVMFTEEIIRPVLSAMKVSYNLLLVTHCSLSLSVMLYHWKHCSQEAEAFVVQTKRSLSDALLCSSYKLCFILCSPISRLQNCSRVAVSYSWLFPLMVRLIPPFKYHCLSND